jgi:hypothetical protein
MAQPGRQVFDKSVRVIGITLRDKKRGNHPDLRIDRNERPNISDPFALISLARVLLFLADKSPDLVHLDFGETIESLFWSETFACFLGVGNDP